MSLTTTATTGVKWSSASHFGRRALSLATNIVLARLLAPSDFGLVGMAAVVIGFVEVFRDMGTAAAIIQRPKVSELLLSSIFWINAVFGCLAMAVLLLVAPLFGLFYQSASVVPVLQMLSFSFPLSGLGILQQAMMERRLAFQTLAKIEIVTAAVASAVGILSALSGFGVWSLVYQTLVSTLLTTVLLWFVTRWRPRFAFSWNETRSVMRFSINLTAFNVFNYFARHSDNFLIGRYLGAEALGYYDLAYKLMVYPLQGISAVIGRVMFPLYAQLQDDLKTFRSAFLSVAWAIAFVSFPMMLGLAVVAQRFVLTVFGDKWEPVIGLLVIFAPLGAIQSVATTVGSIYQARGRTDWLLRWELVAGTLIVLSFVIGLNWGVLGVAAAYGIVFMLLVYPSFAISFSLIDLRVRQLTDVLWRTLICSLLMAAVVFFVSYTIPWDGSAGWPMLWLVLLIQVALGVICYLTFTWMFNREQMMTLWLMLRRPASETA
jgi:O-antigen/teichoic acid export membrane protein